MTDEIFGVARNAPWYVLLSAGIFGAIFLGGYVKRFLSKEGVNTADDKATVNSIVIYKGLVEDYKAQLIIERESRQTAEGKYDSLLENYAKLSGEIAALRLTVQHQADQISAQNEQLDRQDKTILELRDQIQTLTGKYYVQPQV